MRVRYHADSCRPCNFFPLLCPENGELKLGSGGEILIHIGFKMINVVNCDPSCSCFA